MLDGSVHHVRKYYAPGIGILNRYCLVQLDSQAWFAGRDDVTVLPSNWLLEDLSVETAECLDAFLD